MITFTADQSQPKRTYPKLLKCWYAHPLRQELTHSEELVMQAIFHNANDRWFAPIIEISKKVLAQIAMIWGAYITSISPK